MLHVGLSFLSRVIDNNTKQSWFNPNRPTTAPFARRTAQIHKTPQSAKVMTQPRFGPHITRINIYIPQTTRWSLLVGASGAVRGSASYSGDYRTSTGTSHKLFVYHANAFRTVSSKSSFTMKSSLAHLSHFWKGLSPATQTSGSYINLSIKLCQQLSNFLLNRQDSPVGMEITR
jgi:hypothetical protein